MGNNRITNVKAREIIDCRWSPTIQVEIEVDGGTVGVGNCPAGRSTGSDEANELRDGDGRYGGRGCLRAVENVEGEIRGRLIGMDVTDQRKIDRALCELDGTPNKARLGANAIVATSVAAACAGANAVRLPLYRYLNNNSHVLPVPMLSLLEGGAGGFQEFGVFPVGAESFAEALEWGGRIFEALRGQIAAYHGGAAARPGESGGFFTPAKTARDSLALLWGAVERAGLGSELVKCGVDCAATHWYDKKTGLYTLDGAQYDAEALLGLYRQLAAEFPIATIEDPFDESDVKGFQRAADTLDLQVIGDDFFVTNPEIMKPKMALGCGNALVWKFNQVGTLSQAFDAAQLAFRNNYAVMVSERSGETEDSAIADLAVALDAGQIKAGAACRSERAAKYNRLLQIEEELGKEAVYAGYHYRNAYHL